MRAYPKGPPKPETEKIAEKIIGAAAVATTLLVNPLAGALVMFVGVGTGSYLLRKSDFNREVKRLEKSGYVALTKTQKGWIVKILKKGQERYKKIQIGNLTLPRSREWDGKWRVFIFDIPEEIRSRRDSLREKLKSLGLYNIQRSVFVYPFDCRKELDFVAGYYDLDKFTTYGELSYTDINKELKKHFRSLKILS